MESRGEEMNISLKLFASLARSFGNFKTNIIRNEDIVIKAYVMIIDDCKTIEQHF